MTATSCAFRHQYHQTLVYKLMMCARDFVPKDMKGRAKLSDFSEPVGIPQMTYEQCLEFIKKIDAITLGMPKIVYLVGWQKGGHDAQYPAWGPLDQRLKREQDQNALESYNWLFQEAKKYNTTVSVHINMIDAHPFSPLWDLYYQKDIIAKEKDGSLRSYVWGFPISYTREWELGLAQKRIDEICRLLPLQEAGTVHIDAFHTCVPLLEDESCISPYLGITAEQEAETQRKIFSYWRSKGVDVTAEFASRFRIDPFIGLQPMAWHFNDLDILNIPASLYCGGDGGDPRVGRAISEKVFRPLSRNKDMEGLAGALAETTFLWYYLNRLRRITIDGEGAVIFENGVKSWITSNEETKKEDAFAANNSDYCLHVTKNGEYICDGNDLFVPALWREMTIIAHSKEGYVSRSWAMPEEWKDISRVVVWDITVRGVENPRALTVENGRLTLSMKPGETWMIAPEQIL